MVYFNAVRINANYRDSSSGSQPRLKSQSNPLFGKVTLKEVDQALAEQNEGACEFRLKDTKSGDEFVISGFKATFSSPSTITFMPNNEKYVAVLEPGGRLVNQPGLEHFPGEEVDPFKSDMAIEELEIHKTVTKKPEEEKSEGFWYFGTFVPYSSFHTP